MGKKEIALHEEDARHLQQLRGVLIRTRLDAGLAPVELSVQAGRNADFIASLERHVAVVPKASTWQAWARVLYLRLEFEVQDLWLFTSQPDEQLLQLQRQSRAWGADVPARRLLAAQLRLWRMCRGWDTEQVAPLLGVSGESVARWELDSHDPALSRAMGYARVLGTSVRVRVFRRDEWIFG